MRRPAFTMIELVFVIIILGIVSAIGSQIIVQAYESYILQRAIHKASQKTSLAAQQIVNYLEHAIPGTTLARNPSNLNDSIFVYEVDPSVGQEDNVHIALEWIGEADESFSHALPAGWNGFADVDASSQSAIVTPGSKLSVADTVIKNLSSNSVSLNPAASRHPAIFFRDILYTKNPDKAYDAKTCMGMVSSDRTCISTVTNNGDEQLNFAYMGSATQKVIVEHYKLAWSAYALVPLKPGSTTQPCSPSTGDTLCDLYLYYNYQPWENDRLNLSTTPHTLVASNITVFKFAELSGTLRFKLCAQSKIGDGTDDNMTICKEKAVIR